MTILLAVAGFTALLVAAVKACEEDDAPDPDGAAQRGFASGLLQA